MFRPMSWLKRIDHLSGHFCAEHLTVVTTPLVFEVKNMRYGYLRHIGRKKGLSSFLLLEKGSSIPKTSVTAATSQSTEIYREQVKAEAVVACLRSNIST